MNAKALTALLIVTLSPSKGVHPAGNQASNLNPEMTQLIKKTIVYA